MTSLFLSHYSEPDAARQAELCSALARNLENPLIDAVWLLDEKGSVCVDVAEAPKIRQIPCLKRPGFDQFFEAIALHSGENDINILANSDIFFDESLSVAAGIGADDCYALSRWDTDDVEPILFNTPDSQDAWIFRGPPRRALIEASRSFAPGVGGCDNRLAYEFEKAGYRVSNPSKSIRALHLHKSGVRRWSKDHADLVPRPYLLVTPAALGEQPEYRRLY